MARRTRRNSTTSKLMWYGLYAAVGYYAYNWWRQRQQIVAVSTPQTPPAGTN